MNIDVSWLDSVDADAVPVQVVGTRAEGIWEFSDLAAARQKFPELDPYRSTARFTWAMWGAVNDMAGLRFETWVAYDVYSG